MQEITSAVRSGKGGPPILQEVKLLEAFWSRLGVSESELRTWPRQKIADYTRVWQIEAALNNSQQASTGGGATGGSQADATEQAFQQMAAQSRPRTPAT